MKHTYSWIGLSALIILCDQLSKLAAEHWLQLHQPVNLMPFFNLLRVYNTGAAFSFLSHAGGWQRWFFVILTLSVSAFLILWLLKLPRQARWTRTSLALILGGAVGNLVDRLVYGHVIDFIDWFYTSSNAQCWPMFFPHINNTCHWPTFNIADSAITVGAVILMTISLLNLESSNKKTE